MSEPLEETEAADSAAAAAEDDGAVTCAQAARSVKRSRTTNQRNED